MNRQRMGALARTTAAGLTDTFAAAVDRGAAFVVRNAQFVLALAATLLFYLPSLRNGSIDAGFLYTGDVLGYHWPSMVKTHSLISSFQFSGIDFSQFNGSADWFISPNFFGFHPLFVVYSLLTSPTATSVQDIGRVLVLILAFHTFVACYFSLRLLTRFFALGLGVAAFAASAFAFSIFMVGAHGQPMFIFCASIMPWAAYAALYFEERPSVPRLLFACVPVLIAYLSGYMPLGVACLALSVALGGGRLILLADAEIALRDRARRMAVALAPFFAATILIAPYMYSIYSFYGDSPAARASSLFFSAHEMADLPQSLLRVVSISFPVLGPIHEFSVSWGLIAIVVAALFFLSTRAHERLSAWEWKILKISAVIYFATALCTFGQFSVVSDLVYYLIPQVGTMHIYQRFLLPAQLLLALMIALMLQGVVRQRPRVALRIVLATLAAAMLAAAYVMVRAPALAQEIGVNNYIVFELFLAFLVVLALTIPGDIFAFVVAIALSSLPALDRMYDYSVGGNTLQAQKLRQGVRLDEDARAGLLAYLKRFGDKAVIKYVDITPLWTKGLETFPKSFPYVTLTEVPLSSYGGFSFYLSTRADYMRRLPIQGDVQVTPDWEWLENTGADFIVARESDLKGALAARLGALGKEDVYRLPNDVVVTPLRAAGKSESPHSLFDNGYFRIVPPGTNLEVKNPQNIALTKPARQSSTILGADAQRATDGVTNGVFATGSVTHTANDVHAWWEVDLGKVEPIDSVRVWNRTDGATFRLRDFWVFISEQPFGDKDVAASLRTRAGTWGRISATPSPKVSIKSPGVRGRYVRVQLGGYQTVDEAILSLAEVEVFRSNAPPPEASPGAAATAVKLLEFKAAASYVKLDVEASGAATAQYLFWKNPRLRFYLNGEPARVVDNEGLQTIDLRSGRNTIEVHYRHWPLTIFWFVYAGFGIACIVASVLAALEWKRRRAASQPSLAP